MRVFEYYLLLQRLLSKAVQIANERCDLQTYLHSLPRHRIKEDVDSLLRRFRELLDLGRRIFRHPESMQHVISPIPGRPRVPQGQHLPAHLEARVGNNLQLSNYNLLHDIPRHRVEDVE